MEPSEQRETEDRLRRRIEAYHEAALAYAAVKLTLPETMGTEAWTAKRLAAALDLSVPHLERVLRGLVTLGLAEEGPNEATETTYVLTKAGHALAPGASILREKLLIVIEQYWQPWAHLVSSVTTGRPAFEHVFGESVLEWRRSNAEQGEVFDTYLARETFANAAPILDRLDVTGVETVADLGGGHGGFLGAILLRHAHLRGVLVGPAQSEAAARTHLQSLGVAGNVDFVSSDIEQAVPQVADLYLLKNVLQNYDDAGTHKVLENCRKALKRDCKLVVVERLMPDRVRDDPAAIMLDLHMMTITGGKARTRAEMEALLSDARLAIAACSQTDDGLTVIEATAA